jgi:hypothetical protein
MCLCASWVQQPDNHVLCRPPQNYQNASTVVTQLIECVFVRHHEDILLTNHSALLVSIISKNGNFLLDIVCSACYILLCD